MTMPIFEPSLPVSASPAPIAPSNGARLVTPGGRALPLERAGVALGLKAERA